MTEKDIDRIVEIHARVVARKTIPERKQLDATAQCSGFTAEQVEEVLKREGVLV